MQIGKDLLKGGTAIMVLSLLDHQPMYGYEMIKVIEERSQGAFCLKEGTLYPLLHKMEQEGLLHAYWSGREGSRQRKYYEITGSGRNLLANQKKEWDALSTGINRVIRYGEVLICRNSI